MGSDNARRVPRLGSHIQIGPHWLAVLTVLIGPCIYPERVCRVEQAMLHQPDVARDPEDRIIDEQNERDVREKMLDKTIADSFPSSDPPSSIPDPDNDSFEAGAGRRSVGENDVLKKADSQYRTATVTGSFLKANLKAVLRGLLLSVRNRKTESRRRTTMTCLWTRIAFGHEETQLSRY